MLIHFECTSSSNIGSIRCLEMLTVCWLPELVEVFCGVEEHRGRVICVRRMIPMDGVGIDVWYLPPLHAHIAVLCGELTCFHRMHCVLHRLLLSHAWRAFGHKLSNCRDEQITITKMPLFHSWALPPLRHPLQYDLLGAPKTCDSEVFDISKSKEHRDHIFECMH